MKSILVVDDEPDVLDVATVRLKHLGYEIVKASDAETAVEILKKNLPDLILLDLLLPKMQGDQLCQKLKADERTRKIPVIIFTASAIRTDLHEKIKEIGADDLMLKPFEPAKLISKIKKFIG